MKCIVQRLCTCPACRTSRCIIEQTQHKHTHKPPLSCPAPLPSHTLSKKKKRKMTRLLLLPRHGPPDHDLDRHGHGASDSDTVTVTARARARRLTDGDRDWHWPRPGHWQLESEPGLSHGDRRRGSQNQPPDRNPLALANALPPVDSDHQSSLPVRCRWLCRGSSES